MNVLEHAADQSARRFVRGTPPLTYLQDARFVRSCAVSLGLTHDCPECYGSGWVADTYGSDDLRVDVTRCTVCKGTGKRVRG